MSREGPFDIHQDHPHSVASPRLLQDNQGCPFRMTSYDEILRPDFTPVYGVQLHDPRLLEYVGAPESARLTSRSPEYWVHHMGREKALSAALQLQHYSTTTWNVITKYHINNVQSSYIQFFYDHEVVMFLLPTVRETILASHAGVAGRDRDGTRKDRSTGKAP